MVVTPLRGDETVAVVASRRQQGGRRFATTRRSSWWWRSPLRGDEAISNDWQWLAGLCKAELHDAVSFRCIIICRIHDER